MKALVLYRSYYGNTRTVAESIGTQLRDKGYEPTVQDVRQRLPDVSQIDLVFNGAPTRIKRVNRRSLGILRKLKAKGISSKPIAIFDTCAVIPTKPEELEEAKKWIFPGAAGIMHSEAKKIGLNVFPETLRCQVNEMKGPLVANVIQQVTAFVDSFVASTKK